MQAELWDLVFAMLSLGLFLVPFLSIPLFLLFEIGVFTPCHCKLEVFKFVLIFIGVCNQEFDLSLRGNFGFGLLSNTEIVKTWQLLKKDSMRCTWTFRGPGVECYSVDEEWSSSQTLMFSRDRGIGGCLHHGYDVTDMVLWGGVWSEGACHWGPGLGRMYLPYSVHLYSLFASWPPWHE